MDNPDTNVSDKWPVKHRMSKVSRRWRSAQQTAEGATKNLPLDDLTKSKQLSWLMSKSFFFFGQTYLASVLSFTFQMEKWGQCVVWAHFFLFFMFVNVCLSSCCSLLSGCKVVCQHRCISQQCDCKLLIVVNRKISFVLR